ncbi:hypothetical protein HOH67_00615 [Candidatus Peregrinibacteria bacterium]|jgi:hypothetical protein|nr:hypothetical protein [Candidatus Peregrinibacteria bacterium]MBT5823614.1 hypothetical protein [Candidatus Peregrinibacteria bacterium]
MTTAEEVIALAEKIPAIPKGMVEEIRIDVPKMTDEQLATLKEKLENIAKIQLEDTKQKIALFKGFKGHLKAEKKAEKREALKEQEKSERIVELEEAQKLLDQI